LGDNLEIIAEDLIKALTNIRNTLMDELAKAHAYIAKLEREVAQAIEPPPKPPEPPAP